eukprot:473849-Rhodomonas_salina.2
MANGVNDESGNFTQEYTAQMERLARALFILVYTLPRSNRCQPRHDARSGEPVLGPPRARKTRNLS